MSRKSFWFFLFLSIFFLCVIFYHIVRGEATYFDGAMTVVWITNIYFSIDALMRPYDAK